MVALAKPCPGFKPRSDTTLGGWAIKKRQLQAETANGPRCRTGCAKSADPRRVGESEPQLQAEAEGVRGSAPPPPPRNLQHCSLAACCLAACTPARFSVALPNLTPAILQPCSLQPCSCSLRLLWPGSAALAGGLAIHDGTTAKCLESVRKQRKPKPAEFHRGLHDPRQINPRRASRFLRAKSHRLIAFSKSSTTRN